jgi:site-specific DNA recombinase
MQGVIPAIIDKKTWKAVQARMEDNKKLGRAKSKNRRQYLLSGIITCGECGSSFVGQPSKNSRGYETVYYTCSGRKRKNGCTNKPIARDWIEEKAIECVAAMCDALDAEKLMEDANRILKKMRDDQDQERKRQEALLAQKRREETNLVSSIARMGGNRALEERLLETQIEIENLEDYIESLAPRIITEYKADAIAAAMQSVINGMRTGTPEARKEALQSVVEGVEVYKDRIVIKIKAGLDETSFPRTKVVSAMVAEAGFEPATSGL